MNIFKRNCPSRPSTFSPLETRNINFWIAGITLYKFGIEVFFGSVVTLALIRYEAESTFNGQESRAFERLGLLLGLQQAMQCVGSILVGPLVKRYPIRSVLACAIGTFSFSSSILLVVDAATGGRFAFEHPAAILEFEASDNTDLSEMDRVSRGDGYGTYAPDLMIPIFMLCGLCFGMCEMTRRIIPLEIVGGDIQKLRKMDALVHIYYTLAGTVGSFMTALVLIPRLGDNRSFIVTPLCFLMSVLLWTLFIRKDPRKPSIETIVAATASEKQPRRSWFRAVYHSLWLFCRTVRVGARLLCTRRFAWLVPSYAVGMYAHKYIENGLAPQIARRILDNGAWSQLIVGGSNCGELLGAIMVFFLAEYVETPIPWLRVDSFLMLVVWSFPFLEYSPGNMSVA